ncbi:hypothetical protein [Pedobacter aquatilis]|uniref:hypothetical protein n=1 Tax=Pedobacter aquatilis TaxID=351343 RepID=UPI00292CE965|nr:hypothetical protein [Pedobacter aquatilis]
MKSKITILISLLIYSFANAQKVDLDRAYATYAFTSLPSNPLPAEYKSYNVSATLNTSSANISASEIEDRGNISGFQKVDKKTKADLSVQFKFGDFMIDNAEIKERVEITKDKTGKETGRKYYYWAVITYSFSGSFRLVNNILGHDLMNSVLQTQYSKLTHNSSEYSTRSEASSYWNNNKETIKSNLITEAVKSRIDQSNSIITNKYGYRQAKYNYLIWFQGEKKHSEFELNNKMIEQLKAASLLIRGNQPITPEIKESFKPVIDYFNDVKTRFSKDDKSDKKMRYSAFFNLGFIYVMLEDFPNARKEAEGLFNNDYDKKDSKDIIKEIDNAEEQLKINNTTTRHFVSKRVSADTL